MLGSCPENPGKNVAAGELVTLEHTPPKPFGGATICLTCRSCNAAASGSLDQALALMNRELSGGGVKVRLNIVGTEQTTHLLSDSALRTRLAKLASNPGAKQLSDQLVGRKLLL